MVSIDIRLQEILKYYLKSFIQCYFADFFLKVLIEGEKYGESKRSKIASLEKIVNEGRYVNMLHWEQLNPLFASFTEKERESVTKYSQASNLSFRLEGKNHDVCFQ